MSSTWLFEILSGIYNVEFLKLSRCILQALTDFPELLEKLPDQFQKLKHVMLELEPPSVHAVLNFLDSFPCTETLVWDRCPDESWFSRKREEWVANLPFQRIFKCLKTFVMQNSSDIEVEMKFLEFLLERAIVLEELIIKSWRPSYSDMKKKLLSVPRASSTASISFPENDFL
ncbi:hypothetical protein FRX31_013914 [Thalictrum thalictroides]|uniref:FBD domain-containing protein n=1 Tax=Thalictrum thalictroides TaxID=46969 RepID=A0A7J6WGE5_THATH|nr:hypothetical protein FRX31_013914 [Thalictrum thalictroides]